MGSVCLPTNLTFPNRLAALPQLAEQELSEAPQVPKASVAAQAWQGEAKQPLQAWAPGSPRQAWAARGVVGVLGLSANTTQPGDGKVPSLLNGTGPVGLLAEN